MVKLSLYWIKDFYNERYQVALKNMDKDIFGMVVHIQGENANEIPEKSFTEKMCLDLGKDCMKVML